MLNIITMQEYILYYIHWIWDLSFKFPSWASAHCLNAIFFATTYTIIATWIYTFPHTMILSALSHIIPAYGTCSSKSYLLYAIWEALFSTYHTFYTASSKFSFKTYFWQTISSFIILDICASIASLQDILVKI